ncbi:MAG: LLM class flavin-dependent oxidoreductase [Nitrososphaerota archaeon]|nr:LLM class flavin-dependent oxidoreductase [Nitrososphaerota archaeon]
MHQNSIKGKKIGVTIGGMPARDCARIASVAEEKGAHSAWAYEILGRDAFTVLTSMALSTQRIQLATGLISLYIRTPTLTAMTALSIDEISSGRMNLGLGVSYEQALKQRHGIAAGRPFQYLREYIDIIRGISSNEQFSYQGDIFQFKDFRLGYKPVRNKFPIYVGAHNPKMLEFAGEFADGVLLNVITADELPAFINHIEIGAKRSGRSIEDIEIASFFNCCASEDRSVRIEELRKRMGWFLVMPHILGRLKRVGRFRSEAEQAEKLISSGPVREKDILELATDDLIDHLCVTDPPEEILNSIDCFRKKGITLPILFPTPIHGDAVKGYEDLLKTL